MTSRTDSSLQLAVGRQLASVFYARAPTPVTEDDVHEVNGLALEFADGFRLFFDWQMNDGQEWLSASEADNFPSRSLMRQMRQAGWVV